MFPYLYINNDKILLPIFSICLQYVVFDILSLECQISILYIRGYGSQRESGKCWATSMRNTRKTVIVSVSVVTLKMKISFVCKVSGMSH